MSMELTHILQLSVDERIQLAEDIWDSITEFPDALHMTSAQEQELDSRLRAYAQNPNEGIAWPELKNKLLKSQ